MAQERTQKYSFTFKSERMASAFKKIEKTTSYMITFSHEDVANYVVTCNIHDQSINGVMNEVIGDKPLTYKVEGRFITVSPRKRAVSPQRQPICVIKGEVVDDNHDALPGAHLRIEGQKWSAVSRPDGKFTVVVRGADTYTLIVSYVGMADKYIPVSIKEGQENAYLGAITLHEEKNMLDEVVVTGYQNLKKSQVAGSISQVKAEDIKIGGVQNISDMLQGQVAGMNVILNSGDPGAAPKIRIRGTSSILGNRSPLWVLDGVILSEDDMGEVNTTDLNGDDAAYLVGNAIAGINPNDIDKITVLKDASATAIYGVQAANGVIVVTTKQGTAGTPKISYSGSYKINQRMSYGDLNRMNATERLQLSEEIIADNAYYYRTPVSYGYEGLYMDYMSRNLTYDQFASGVQKLADMNTDWYDILFRNSFTHSHALNLSGGNAGTRYYASFGYDDTESTAIKNNSKRFTAMAKLNSWLIKNKLYVGFQLNASTRNTLGFHPSVNPNTYAYNTSRAIPCYNDDGSLYYYDTYNPYYRTFGNTITKNILNEMDQTGSKARVNTITAQMNLQWKIWGGLEYKMQLSYQNSNSTKKTWATDESYYVSNIRGYYKGFLDVYEPLTESDKTKAEIEDRSVIPVGGIYSRNNSQSDTYTIQNTLEFNRTFHKDHMVNLMAVSEVRQVKTDGLSGTYYGWQPDRGETFNPVLTSAYVSSLSSGSLTPYITLDTRNTVSWIFTGSYSYKDKFIFNTNMRMDGSNQFGSNPKYRFLPIWSVSGKYTLSNEKFMQKQNIITYLALRASYGIQGNVDGSTSPDLVLRLGAKNNVTGQNISNIAYLPNPDLRWEKTRSYNFGLDLSLLDNRISFVIDTYSKRGTDMIMTKNVSQTNGYQTLKINAGKVNNKGIEIGANFIPFKTKDWDITVGVNYSYNKNKLIDANESLNTTDEKLSGNALVVGEALGTLYSYDFVGLNHESGYPVFRAKDGTTTFTNSAGNEYPNYVMYQDDVNLVKSGVLIAPNQGGINLSVGYKGLRLSGSFTYQFGGVGRLASLYEYSSSTFDPMSNVSKDYAKRWRQPGDEEHTNIPVLFNRRVFSSLFNKDYISGQSYLYPTSLYDSSTARVAKTDFLKLRSLTLNYVVPKKFLSRFNLTQLMIGLQATNLFTWADSRWEGSDPEAAYATTPLSRAYSLNVNLTF